MKALFVLLTLICSLFYYAPASAIYFNYNAKPTYDSGSNAGESTDNYNRTSVNLQTCITPEPSDLFSDILWGVNAFEEKYSTPYYGADIPDAGMYSLLNPSSTSQQCQTFKVPILKRGANYYGSFGYNAVTSDIGYTNGDYGSQLIIYTGTELPVYRFWSDQKQKHFYTNTHSEKTYVDDNYPQWDYERIAFVATQYDTNCPDGIPVYRFWSDQKQGHFYTASWNERQSVIANYSNIWKLERTAYCAGSTQTAKYSVPLYRFWSDQKQSHFYTADWNERQDVIARYPDIWKYEGIAYYVAPY